MAIRNIFSSSKPAIHSNQLTATSVSSLQQVAAINSELADN